MISIFQLHRIIIYNMKFKCSELEYTARCEYHPEIVCFTCESKLR